MIRLFKGKLRISPLVIPAAVIIAYINSFSSLIGLFLALLIHEAAHAAMASALNVEVDRLELHPFGCAAVITGIDELRTSALFLIALAGPAASAICYCLARENAFGSAAAESFCTGCMGLAAVNLLPTSKTDGGRMLYAIVQRFIGEDETEKIITVLSFLIGTGFLILFVMTTVKGQANLSLIAMAFFVFITAISELRRKRLLRARRKLFRGRILSTGDATAVHHAVKEDFTVRDALRIMRAGSYNVFYCIGADMRIKAKTDEGEIFAKAEKEGGSAHIFR